MILNRTVSKAEDLARLLNGSAGSLDQLDEEIIKADIVICSISSPQPVITKEKMESLLSARDSRSLYFIDIAVPRNVDAGVHELDNVYVYNIDDLKSLVEENLSQRRDQVGLAAKMVDKMATEFYEWVQATLEGRDLALRHTHLHVH